MPTAAVTARRYRINAVKWSALTGQVGPGYADGLSYADRPRRRTSGGPDGLVYADGPVGIDECMPTAFLRLRPFLGRRHRSIDAAVSIDLAVGNPSFSGSAPSIKIG